MNPLLMRHVTFPLYHALSRTGLMALIQECEKNQWRTREELCRIQEKKLRTILEHAYTNVPFYRERFAAAGIDPICMKIPDDLSRIPLLTKSEINANRERMVALNSPRENLSIDSTSGSTGEALRFYSDSRSRLCREASVVVCQRWMGIDIGDRRACLWGAPMDLKRSRRLRERIHSWFMNSLFLSSYAMSEERMEVYVQELNRFKPSMFLSYPGPLSVFSEYLIASKKRIHGLKAVLSSGEMLHPKQRNIVEEAFSEVPIYNRYGCREFGNLAHECERHERMHVDIGRIMLEVVSEHGTPLLPGEPGEIVITDLDNYGMPLIRYRIGDMGSLEESPCSCGRGLPVLKSIEGRTMDVVVASNGNRLGGTFWTFLFKSRPGVKTFQIIQDELDHIAVNYVPDGALSTAASDSFLARIREKCGPQMKVSFHQVTSIPKTVSGKTQFVVSHLGRPSPANDATDRRSSSEC